MLLIFDWDGTLSNSTDKIIDCMQKAAVVSKFKMSSRSAVRDIIGLGLPEAIQALYPDLNESDRLTFKDAYVSEFLAADQRPSDFYDDVLDGLNLLKEKGFLLAVATGKSRRGLDRVLSNLGLSNFFHGTRCADETVSKPNPAMLTELLEEFCCDANKAVMVGDTEYDMSMAEQIGMPRVAVSYGAHDVKRLRAYQPLFCVDKFSEFVDWALSKKE